MKDRETISDLATNIAAMAGLAAIAAEGNIDKQTALKLIFQIGYVSLESVLEDNTTPYQAMNQALIYLARAVKKQFRRELGLDFLNELEK